MMSAIIDKLFKVREKELISKFLGILKKADYMEYPNAYLKQEIRKMEDKLKE